jgi:hypothetical protein
MCPLRRIADDRAGPSALGILVPPGPRTFLILRPRALPWDLVLLRDDGATFHEMSRPEAQAAAHCLFAALEDGPDAGVDPFEAAHVPGGCWLRVAVRSYRLVVCRRAPGQAYRPAVFADVAGAEAVAASLQAVLFPTGGAVQEVYFNQHHFHP